MSSDRRLIAVGVPLALFFVSFFVPVTGSLLVRSDALYYGHEAFVVGFRAILLFVEEGPHEEWGIALSWFANPTMCVALGFLIAERRRATIIAAGVACALSLFVLPRWGTEVIDYPGYWCWWGSSVTALLSALFLLPRPRPACAEDFETMTTPPQTPDP
jgi:hypothetical protein